MDFLVTGGEGFIGHHVARHLAEKFPNSRVVSLDNLSGSYHKEAENIYFHWGRYGDKYTLDEVFNKYNFKAVWHFGSYAPEVLSHFRKAFIWENNMLQSVELLNKCINSGVKRIVFASSAAVYGNLKVPFTEIMTPKPADTYGIAKLAFERELEISHEIFGLDYSILRMYNVFGEGQWLHDAYRNVFGIWANRLLRGLPPVIYGNGKQIRSFTYVKDILEYIALAGLDSRARNQVFNLGSEKPISLNEACRAFLQAAGSSLKPEYIPKRHEVMEVWCSSKKARHMLGDIPTTSLLSGLERMWEWSRTQKVKEFAYSNGYEITKNLPDAWKSKKI